MRKKGKRHVASHGFGLVVLIRHTSLPKTQNDWKEKKVSLPLRTRHDVIGSTIYVSFECDGASISSSSSPIRSILMLISLNFLFDQSCDLPRGMPTKHNR